MDIVEELVLALSATTKNLKTLEEMLQYDMPSTANAIRRNIAGNENTLGKVSLMKTKCPFDDGSVDPRLGPKDPCPICGDLGTDEAMDQPSRCVQRGN